jgi:hypothetical protein
LSAAEQLLGDWLLSQDTKLPSPQSAEVLQRGQGLEHEMVDPSQVT